jgi:hypothetical protein
MASTHVAEALLGEVEFTFDEVLQHGKGEHWLPLKWEKYSCAGEILVSMPQCLQVFVVCLIVCLFACLFNVCCF